MRTSTHTAIGLASAAGVCAAAGADTLATLGAFAVSVIGSQMPDADQRGIKADKRQGRR